ncbi:MAG: hypothetical protein FWH29_06325 [Methanobrevibacter sp.]|nr:hypothetical protein [Methanobrevibacter sp.]
MKLRKKWNDKTHLSQMFEDKESNDFVDKHANVTDNAKIEYLSVQSNNGEELLKLYTSGFSDKVYLTEEVKSIGKAKGLGKLVHNHTNKIPLASPEDIFHAVNCQIKETIAITPGSKYNSVMINNNRFKIQNKANDLEKSFNKIKLEMEIEFLKSNPKYANVDPESESFKNAIKKHYQNEKNMLPYYKKQKGVLEKEKIDYKLYDKTKAKYI